MPWSWPLPHQAVLEPCSAHSIPAWWSGDHETVVGCPLVLGGSCRATIWMTSTGWCFLVWKSCRVLFICWIGGQEIDCNTPRSKQEDVWNSASHSFSVSSRMGYRCQSVMMTSGFRCETCPKEQKAMVLLSPSKCNHADQGITQVIPKRLTASSYSMLKRNSVNRRPNCIINTQTDRSQCIRIPPKASAPKNTHP